MNQFGGLKLRRRNNLIVFDIKGPAVFPPAGPFLLCYLKKRINIFRKALLRLIILRHKNIAFVSPFLEPIPANTSKNAGFNQY